MHINTLSRPPSYNTPSLFATVLLSTFSAAPRVQLLVLRQLSYKGCTAQGKGWVGQKATQLSVLLSHKPTESSSTCFVFHNENGTAIWGVPLSEGKRAFLKNKQTKKSPDNVNMSSLGLSQEYCFHFTKL